MKILVTGGLGYIGSHISHLLGKKAVIIDNGINSNLNYKKLLPKAIVYKKSINYINLSKIFKDHKINAIIHLASLKAVGQSVINPLEYFENNIVSAIELLKAMKEHKINNLIFSSTASVYGNKNKSPLKENFNLQPLNPYGRSKIIIEEIISDYCNSNPKFKAISLRYFNAIGANTKASLSDKPLGKPENLIPRIIDSIKKQELFKVYGKNYQTQDGTCIRDYIHVKDIASAHINALRYIKNFKNHTAINLGMGKGLSVLGLIKIFEKENNLKIKYTFTKRRQGDPEVCFADNRLAKIMLNWSPKHSYEEMLKDAWNSSK